MTTAEARKHSNEYDFGFPGLLDPAQQLVRKSGATRTPEAAVFSPDGKLLYRGRIDDRYVDFGKKRDRPGQRDLDPRLEACAAAGRIFPSMAEGDRPHLAVASLALWQTGNGTIDSRNLSH